jgi:hypothetical protein
MTRKRPTVAGVIELEQRIDEYEKAFQMECGMSAAEAMCKRARRAKELGKPELANIYMRRAYAFKNGISFARMPHDPVLNTILLVTEPEFLLDII